MLSPPNLQHFCGNQVKNTYKSLLKRIQNARSPWFMHVFLDPICPFHYCGILVSMKTRLPKKAVGWFLLTPTNSLTPTGCLRIQFSSDTNNPELEKTSQYKGSGPQDCPHFRCWVQKRCPGYPHFCPANYKFGVSMISLQV